MILDRGSRHALAGLGGERCDHIAAFGIVLPLLWWSDAWVEERVELRPPRDRSTHRGAAARIDAMPNRDPNDTRLVTPLLLMGLIVVCGLLYYAYIGHAW